MRQTVPGSPPRVCPQPVNVRAVPGAVVVAGLVPAYRGARLDPVAASTGVVNTVRFEAHGMVVGHNTDVHGVKEALRTVMSQDEEGSEAPAAVLGRDGPQHFIVDHFLELGRQRIGSCERVFFEHRERASEPVDVFVGDGGEDLLELGVETVKGLDRDAQAWLESGAPTTYHFLDINLDEPADFDARWLRLVEPLRAFRFVFYAAWIARRPPSRGAKKLPVRPQTILPSAVSIRREPLMPTDWGVMIS